MKILYVNPGKIEAGLDYIIKGPPLALLTIAAMVPEHEATLFDFKVDKYKEKNFRKLLREHDVCAITSMTPQISHAFEVAEMAKEEGCTTIIGGYHPTLEPDYVIKHSAVDFIVRGEGEHTFRELITYIDSSEQDTESSKKKEILGISYKTTEETIQHNDQRPLEADLDKFPIPRRDLLKGKKYQYLGTRVMLMETSRGCPHNCKFCCIIKMWADGTNTMRYRAKSINRIIEEIYSIDLDAWDFIFFNDDNFTINVKRTKAILEVLIKSKLHRKVFFSCQSRVDTLYKNKWLAPMMREAGFRQIFLGIESVHQQSLDAMNKRSNVNMIQEACKMCTDNGISMFGGMIIGFPGETMEMVRENTAFAQSLGLDFVQFTPITAFPGTEFFEEMRKAGKVDTLEWKYYNLFYPMLHTDEISREDMYRLVAESYAKFYMGKDFFKQMAHRALLNPNFKWYRKIGPRWLKQVVMGGWKMLAAQGVSSDLIIEISTEKEDHSQGKWHKYLAFKKDILKYRYEKFKQLLVRAQEKQIDLEPIYAKMHPRIH